MRTNALPVLLVSAGVLAFGLSCQGGETQTQEPSAANETRASTSTQSSSPAPDPGKLVFSDDFSGPGSGWERQRDEGSLYSA